MSSVYLLSFATIDETALQRLPPHVPLPSEMEQAIGVSPRSSWGPEHADGTLHRMSESISNSGSPFCRALLDPTSAIQDYRTPSPSTNSDLGDESLY